MNFEFSISKSSLPEILNAINKATWSRRINRKRKYGFILLSVLSWIPIGVVLAYAAVEFDSQVFNLAVTSGFVVFVALRVEKFFQNKILQNMHEEPGIVLGPKSIELTDEHISVDTHSVRSIYKLSAIQEVLTVRQFVFLFIDLSQAIVIPKSAIGSEEEVSKFVFNTQQLIRKAQSADTA